MDPVTNTWLCPYAETLTGDDAAHAGVTLISWLVPSQGFLQPVPLSSPSPDFSAG